MPAKNIIKEYVGGSYYHIYNRGVNKTEIFLDGQDYGVFLSYLKNYLTPKDEKILLRMLSSTDSNLKDKEKALQLLRLKNYFDKIRLIAYCLMPNHFHLLVWQNNDRDIKYFIQSLATRYTSYVKGRYKRVGPLFQGNYKAVLVRTDEQLLHLSRYIHQNPISLKRSNLSRLDNLLIQPSSYSNYLGKIQQDWVKPEIILDYFPKDQKKSYKKFVEDQLDESSYRLMKNLMLDED